MNLVEWSICPLNVLADNILVDSSDQSMDVHLPTNSSLNISDLSAAVHLTHYSSVDVL